MEIGATATEVTKPAVSVGSDVSAQDDGFGTRPSTDRPHSMSLFGAERAPPRDGVARSLDLLIGLGIGAAVMYYLDPDGGSRRRALARDKVVGAVTMVPDAFDAAANDLARWVLELVEPRPRAAGRASPPLGPDSWTPGGRLVAGIVGAALTILASKRRDALGAAVGLIGSALLGRGVIAPAGRSRSPSEVVIEPVDRELGDALERPRLLEQV